jgi:transposase
MRYYIKEREWEIIFSKLQKIKNIHTTNQSSVRRFIEAVWYVTRSGCQWSLLPDVYGLWRSVHVHFKDWCNKGIWQILFESMHDEVDNESAMIDATIVRAHACSVGYKKRVRLKNALAVAKVDLLQKFML